MNTVGGRGERERVKGEGGMDEGAGRKTKSIVRHTKGFACRCLSRHRSCEDGSKDVTEWFNRVIAEAQADDAREARLEAET